MFERNGIISYKCCQQENLAPIIFSESKNTCYLFVHISVTHLVKKGSN